eukprot:9484227-Pyramimonas_sp.AAC.1
MHSWKGGCAILRGAATGRRSARVDFDPVVKRRSGPPKRARLRITSQKRPSPRVGFQQVAP